MSTSSQVLTTRQTLNQLLQPYGYELTAQDMAALKQSVKRACTAFHLIETQYLVLYELIKTLASSPYADATHYLPMVHDAIFSYYHLRALFSWQISDATILDILFDQHARYGQFDKALIRRCQKQLEAIK